MVHSQLAMTCVYNCHAQIIVRKCFGYQLRCLFDITGWGPTVARGFLPTFRNDKKYIISLIVSKHLPFPANSPDLPDSSHWNALGSLRRNESDR